MYVFAILSILCVSASFIVVDGRLAQVYSDGDSDTHCELEHGDCNRDKNEVSFALKSSGCTEWCQCKGVPSPTGGSVVYQWLKQACPSMSLFDDRLGRCNYYSHMVQCEEPTTTTNIPPTESPHTDGPGDGDDDCQQEHGICNIYTYENTLALKSSGCIEWCKCERVANPMGGSMMYQWSKQECPTGRLFDNRWKFCITASAVECDETNECLSNPCANGGTCNNVQNGYTCTCTAGWQGTSCDEDVNECASNPCQNGAKCTNGQNSYTCICAAGWSGATCQTDINECSSNPCANGATCNNLQNHYTCTCTAGWQGTNCDEDINECLSNPCANWGTCINLQNRYTCTCQAGWQGTNCDEDINECLSNPCANGGTCNNLQNRYTCTCPGGWEGTNCNEDINECLSNPCANDATCNNLENRYACTCTEGWQGDNCDEDINECLSNPCANGATCTNLQNRYTCSCTAGWQGTNCEDVKPLEECYKCDKERSNSVCNQKTEVCKDKEKSCETTVKWNGHKYEVSKGCKKATPGKAKAKKSKSKSKLGCKEKGKKIDCRYECTTNLCNEPLPEKDIDK